MTPPWKDTRCVDRGDGNSKCQRPERHPRGEPLFPSREAARAAIVKGPPFPCHKCLMAFTIEKLPP